MSSRPAEGTAASPLTGDPDGDAPLLPPGAHETDAIRALKRALAEHPVAGAVTDHGGLCTFLEHHVLCVWDFMSLLKSLQRDLTGVAVPWVPAGDPEAARLVNEIVLGEESDALPDGRGFASHFEWYLEAMEQVGCDTEPIRRFLAALRDGVPATRALASSGLPAAAVRFTEQTLAVLDEPLAVRAAVFLHGREDLIPEMLGALARRLHATGTTGRLFVDYLDRHVEVDGDVHGPMCERLLARLIARAPQLRDRALDAAADALRARLALWDALSDACRTTGPSPDLHITALG